MEDFNRDGIDSANFSANFTSTNDETEIFASNDSIVSNFSPFYPPQAAWVAATFAIVFIIVGVIGNLGTIWALLENKKLRGNATTWFVLSLCFSDFLFCTINLPLTASRYIHQAWIFDDLLCQIFPFFFYANFGASLLNITLIAINR
ncbi:Protein trapped in endoderm-1 [Folsomia candida]|uniref:Protein trapped in endoderm-1 n=2 Tax=Folsomia candida TaxID=158441 RepID=A0A226DJV6_FOLCA|nr:Protein trapped in endoderm-1 [Folsomia candida]